MALPGLVCSGMCLSPEWTSKLGRDPSHHQVGLSLVASRHKRPALFLDPVTCSAITAAITRR